MPSAWSPSMVERVDRGDVKQRIALVDDRAPQVDMTPSLGLSSLLILAEQPADARQQVSGVVRCSICGRGANPPRGARTQLAGWIVRAMCIGQPVVGIDHPDTCQYAEHARDAGLDRGGRSAAPRPLRAAASHCGSSERASNRASGFSMMIGAPKAIASSDR